MGKKALKSLLAIFLTFQIAVPNALALTVINETDKTSTNSESSVVETQIQTVESSTPAEKLSPIEEMFNNDLEGSGNLKQIGYDLFSRSNNAQSIGKYDSGYTLNIGERVNIYFYGESMDVISMSGSSLLTPLTNTNVDSKGNIFIQGVGVIKAEGRTISEVEKGIQGLASQKFKNIKVKLTVSNSTEFPVFVYGQVNSPGKVNISGNSSIIEALGAAGGVKKSGSLRKITYTSSNGKEQQIDLYSSIFEGKANNIKLNANDVIYVNNIGSVVALQNGVKVPGIYEVTPGDNILKTITYAGGAMPMTDLSIVNVKTFNNGNGQRISKDYDNLMLKKVALTNGDILQFRTKFGAAENSVTLAGNVKHPAIYEYHSGIKLSDLLKDENELRDETFLYQAVIKRVVGSEKQVVSIPVSLQEFFNGSNNIALQPKDIITVYKNTNMNFVDVFGCINNPKQYPYSAGLTLKDVMSGVQFIVSQKTNEENIVDVKATNSIKDAENGVEQNKEVDPNSLHKLGITSLNNVLLNASDIAVEITDISGNTSTYYLYDILVKDDQLSTIVLNEGDKVFFRPLRDTEVVKTVNVTGYVLKPGVYKFVNGKRLSDVLLEAGGLVDDSNLKGIVFKRERIAPAQKKIIKENNKKDISELESLMTGSISKNNDANARSEMIEKIEKSNKTIDEKYDGRIALKIKSQKIEKIPNSSNIEVQDGDSIYVPKFSNHITVLGEVYNETSFVYSSHMNSKDYIKASGGFTTTARKTKVYKIGVDGSATRLGPFAKKGVEPGDTIVIPKKIRGNDWLSPVCSALQAIASVFSAMYIVTKL